MMNVKLVNLYNSLQIQLDITTVLSFHVTITYIVYLQVSFVNNVNPVQNVSLFLLPFYVLAHYFGTVTCHYKSPFPCTVQVNTD